MSDTSIEIGIDPETLTALDRAASELRTDRESVLQRAIHAFLEVHQRQVERVKEGLAQADRGEFASEEEVKRVFAKWRGR